MRPKFLVIALALAVCASCDRTVAPVVEAARLDVAVDCGDEIITVKVAGGTALDDALCGEPWHAWQVETPRAVELVRRITGRSVWLRRHGDAVVVEVRVDARVTATYAGPTRILWVKPPNVIGSDMITLTQGTASEQLSIAQLATRYPGVGGGRAGEVSLCQLVDAKDPAARIEVEGEGAAPRSFTRAECERDGLLLHASRRGGIQLRDRNKQRYLATVKHITVR